jgi:hypothetical protein
LGEDHGAKPEKFAQALLLHVGFLVVGELPLQHFHLALEAQVLLAYVHEIDITIPEAAEALCETRNGLLERHDHGESHAFE